MGGGEREVPSLMYGSKPSGLAVLVFENYAVSYLTTPFFFFLTKPVVGTSQKAT